jgi:hypothetical protein
MSDAKERTGSNGPRREKASVPPEGSQSTLGSFVQDLQDGDLDKPMELSDFLFRLGFAFQLPEKEQKDGQTDSQARRPGPQRTRRWLPALAVLLLLLWGAAQLSQPRPQRELPRELAGEWVAQSPRYMGRALVLTPGSVTLKFGGDTLPVTFTIATVLRDSVRDTAIFHVQYLQEGQLTPLVVKFFETPRPSLMLSSPPGVLWLRESDVGYDTPKSDSSAGPRVGKAG